MAIVTQSDNSGNSGSTGGLVMDSPEIVGGFWSDPKSRVSIKEAYYGEKVKFTIGTKNIPDGTKLELKLKDYDPVNSDDFLSKYTVFVNGNIAEIEFITDEKWSDSAKYEKDQVVETYFEIKVDIDGDIIVNEFPENKDDFLKLYEKEVKITVLVELPHSLETGWGAKGLAGHTAMAIGNKYFDYGPNNRPGKYSEKDYDVDFNDDGDKSDIVQLNDPSFKNSPGMSWWGNHIANRKGIKPEDVTLNMVLNHIQLHWKGLEQPIGSRNYPNATYIYGKVHKIEFFVNENQANEMIKWWKERYHHLKRYSVFPWTGEQCTTTVKTALQVGGINIPEMTQKPIGILQDFKTHVFSTSSKHRNKKAIITVIKNESIDFKP
ncbi:MAG: hypothetical protein JEZ01_18700 [Labilibaculum sp.]|nr:hypothetical protein [Labilibaculum sp.]MBI9059801.1 hypothetical protein [Labilibaculum sp.]